MSSLQDNRENFFYKIKVEQDEELLRLLKLKQKYDNGDISEDDISEDDARRVIKLYEQEINNLNVDIEKSKNRIKHKLNELKRQK